MSTASSGFIPDVKIGRGAWTKTGKPNGAGNYTYVKPDDDGKPEVDGRLLDDDNYRAVHLAVRYSIQPAIGVPTAQCDGRLGPGSFETLKRWQGQNGLKDDGFFGRLSAAKAFRPIVEAECRERGVPPEHLHGLMSHESGYDPGAVGYATPGDRGLVQVSLQYHGPGTGDGFTEAQVHTASWAVSYGAQRLAVARKTYGGKGADLQARCSLLSHNNPVNALHLYKTGEYRTSQARSYVEAVLRAVGTF